MNHVLGGASPGEAYTPAAQLYLALFTSAPSDTGGGTEVSAGVGYTRAVVANTTTYWPHTTTGTKANGQAITFGLATAGWGLIIAVALFDAASGGNMLYWGTLDITKQINSGDTASFTVGAIQISED